MATELEFGRGLGSVWEGFGTEFDGFGEYIRSIPKRKTKLEPKVEKCMLRTEVVDFQCFFGAYAAKSCPAGSSREESDLRVFITRPRLGDSGATPYWCVSLGNIIRSYRNR